ncbi:MAG: FAD-dependent oxidoreductase, partial [Rhodobacterales bacterium]
MLIFVTYPVSHCRFLKETVGIPSAIINFSAILNIILSFGDLIMKTHIKALVVGGGAVGTGIAYHLAKYGWKDVMLLERDELTSGSTWHAAGLLPLFNMGYATTHLHDYSVDFYK